MFMTGGCATTIGLMEAPNLHGFVNSWQLVLKLVSVLSENSKFFIHFILCLLTNSCIQTYFEQNSINLKNTLRRSTGYCLGPENKTDPLTGKAELQSRWQRKQKLVYHKWKKHVGVVYHPEPLATLISHCVGGITICLCILVLPLEPAVADFVNQKVCWRCQSHS